MQEGACGGARGAVSRHEQGHKAVGRLDKSHNYVFQIELKYLRSKRVVPRECAFVASFRASVALCCAWLLNDVLFSSLSLSLVLHQDASSRPQVEEKKGHSFLASK